MFAARALVVLALVVLALACSPQATATPTPLPTPTPRPTATTPPFTTVTFTTEDGVQLSGRVFGTGKDWVVLAHMLQGDQAAWEPFARQLAGRGYTALSFNFRSYAPSGGRRETDHFDTDVKAAMKYATDSGAAKVFLAGAQIGGTTVLKVGAKQEVPGIIALSAPGRMEAMEFTLAEQINYMSPVLLLVSQGDSSAVQDMRNMYDSIKTEKEIAVLPGNAVGTNMLVGPYAGDATDRIFSFLQRHTG